jgi:hypothetical protein
LLLAEAAVEAAVVVEVVVAPAILIFLSPATVEVLFGQQALAMVAVEAVLIQEDLVLRADPAPQALSLSLSGNPTHPTPWQTAKFQT